MRCSVLAEDVAQPENIARLVRKLQLQHIRVPITYTRRQNQDLAVKKEVMINWL